MLALIIELLYTCIHQHIELGTVQDAVEVECRIELPSAGYLDEHFEEFSMTISCMNFLAPTILMEPLWFTTIRMLLATDLLLWQLALTTKHVLYNQLITVINNIEKGLPIWLTVSAVAGVVRAVVSLVLWLCKGFWKLNKIIDQQRRRHRETAPGRPEFSYVVF